MNQPILRARTQPQALVPAEARDELSVQLEVAREMAKSDLLPAAYAAKPANVFIAINMGKALGLEPTVALYGMHVIDNRPSPSAKLQAALVRRAGHKLRQIESTHERAVCQIVRSDDPEYPVTVEFTTADAKLAGSFDVFAQVWKDTGGGKRYPETWKFPEGLAWDADVSAIKAAGCPPLIADDKRMKRSRRDPWHTRPKVMLWHRAVTECVGAACPEVLAGIDIDTGWEPDWSGAVDVSEVDPVDVLRAPMADVEHAARDEEIEHQAEQLGVKPEVLFDEFIVEAEIEDEPESATIDTGWTVESLKVALKGAGLTQAQALMASHKATLVELCKDSDAVAKLLDPHPSDTMTRTQLEEPF